MLCRHGSKICIHVQARVCQRTRSKHFSFVSFTKQMVVDCKVAFFLEYSFKFDHMLFVFAE